MTNIQQSDKQLFGVFGGAFDPPHMGHLLYGHYYLAVRPHARLLIVPSYFHPFEKTMTPYDTRLAWCHQLVNLLGARAELCDIEHELTPPSYTLDVIKKLQNKYPLAHFELLLGADAYQQRHLWHRFNEIEKIADLFIVGRGELKSPQGYINLPDISSTDIRQRLHNKQSCFGVIPTDILKNLE